MLPARLESNPDAFGPKYESLGDALKTFNQKMVLGEDEISGEPDLCIVILPTVSKKKFKLCLKCMRPNISR